MNYYPHHIGDFRSGTVNMSRQSRWLYRDMLDVYYDTERPLPLDLDLLCDMLGVEAEQEIKLVERLLRFKFVAADDGYHNERCDVEIAAYHAKAEIAKANGKRGGRPPKADGNPKEPSGFPAGSDPVADGNQDLTGSQANQEPRTNNQTSKDNTSGQSPDGDASTGKAAKAPRTKNLHGTPEDMNAVRWMHTRIKLIDPTAKEPTWNAWANEMRLMREVDNRTHRDACELFAWANRDSFWGKNILSPGKLREKWQQLVLARQHAATMAAPRSATAPANRYAGAAAAIYGDDDDMPTPAPIHTEGVIDVEARRVH